MGNPFADWFCGRTPVEPKPAAVAPSPPTEKPVRQKEVKANLSMGLVEVYIPLLQDGRDLGASALCHWSAEETRAIAADLIKAADYLEAKFTVITTIPQRVP
jgi:hypothetical protein